MIDEEKPNYPIKRENISLSVLKRYNLFRSYQKGNKKSGKKGPINICLLYYL